MRLEDLSAGERRLFVAEGKGGRQRMVPVSARFFTAVGAYLESERPRASAARHVFVVLKGTRHGEPLSAAGLDEILDGARARAGLDRATCHQLRHTSSARSRSQPIAANSSSHRRSGIARGACLGTRYRNLARRTSGTGSSGLRCASTCRRCADTGTGFTTGPAPKRP